MVGSSQRRPAVTTSWIPGDRRRLLVPFAVLALIIVSGTLGYATIEGWSLFDSLYQVLITVSTVGFQELRPLTTSGRALTMVLIVGGIGTAAFLFTELANLMLGTRLFARKNMEREIALLHGHYIVCGFGRMGSRVASELDRLGHSVLVVEKDTHLTYQLREQGVMVLDGDATDEAVLTSASVQEAKGLAACLDSDANNLYLVLTAHELRPDLLITAYSHDDRANQRLTRAGATRVISPFDNAGFQMATAMTKPTVLDFIDVVARTRLDLEIAEIAVSAGSMFDGTALVETGIRKEYGVIVVAVKRGGGTLQYNPEPTEKLCGGDTLVVLGPPSMIPRLRESAQH